MKVDVMVLDAESQILGSRQIEARRKAGAFYAKAAPVVDIPGHYGPPDYLLAGAGQDC